MKRVKHIVKTPDSAFADLKDYPFEPHYMELTGGVHMHYVEEGKGNPKSLFLFHGQPSWSYLYRHMIPTLVRQGFHVIAPDLIGFGKSDKPVSPDDHTFYNHVKWMSDFVQKMGIKNAQAFMQDWGA
ncbi:alpha/beta fold hydrolase [bacterium SCSIO 12741]|nr:alpha/beta fold hydrolase [bacterium SCSIO 12741]